MTEPLSWIGPTLILFALGVTLYWYRNGPSIKTQSRIATALQARGLKLLSVKPQLELRLGRGSRVPLVARVSNAFGNVQTLYFDVDIWADLFLPHPNVRELGTHQSSRFMSAGDQ